MQGLLVNWQALGASSYVQMSMMPLNSEVFLLKVRQMKDLAIFYLNSNRHLPDLGSHFISWTGQTPQKLHFFDLLSGNNHGNVCSIH